jgi:hypothetical protein
MQEPLPNPSPGPGRAGAHSTAVAGCRAGRSRTAQGRSRTAAPLARPLEVTRPCLPVRQDGIGVNGRTIAFGGCIEVEPPHPEVFCLGLGGHPDTPEPLASDGARPREQGLVPSAASGASTGRARPFGRPFRAAD